jgi:hypothetical protein
MPHESTVNPFDHFGDENGTGSARRSRASTSYDFLSGGGNMGISYGSDVAALAQSTTARLAAEVASQTLFETKEDEDADKVVRRPATPSELTHHEDFDDDDDDSEDLKQLQSSQNGKNQQHQQNSRTPSPLDSDGQKSDSQ